MGQAKHRNQLPVLGRGPRTHGTGFKYVGTARPVVGVSLEKIAAREAEKASVIAQRGLKEWNVYCLTTYAAKALDAWEDSVNGLPYERNIDTERVVDKS